VLAGMVRELAWQAQCVAVQAVDGGERWVLRVERESLRQPSHRDRLQAAMGDLLELRVQLDVEAGAVSDSAARRDAAAKVLAQAEAEAVILHDPLVQQLLAQYPSARVVPGSIRPR
jgi:DNA polymerase-3 subunit gamma/tau